MGRPLTRHDALPLAGEEVTMSSGDTRCPECESDLDLDGYDLDEPVTVAWLNSALGADSPSSTRT